MSECVPRHGHSRRTTRYSSFRRHTCSFNSTEDLYTLYGLTKGMDWNECRFQVASGCMATLPPKLCAVKEKEVGSTGKMQNPFAGLLASVSAHSGGGAPRRSQSTETSGGGRNAVDKVQSWTSPLKHGAVGKEMASSGDTLISHALKAVELHQAGAELQKVVAFLSGVVLAGMSHANNQVRRGHREIRQKATSSFSDSFSFPWNPRHHEKPSTKNSEELMNALAERGREYERSLDVRAAIQCFEEAVKMYPTDLWCLCMAAKQWSDLTFYHDVKTIRERMLVNMKAIEYAERAIEAHPESPGGYLGMCISKGRLGLFVDNKTKVKLAKEAQEAAHLAIQYGPDNDVAHHLMGRWHHEMSKLNVVVRTIVRLMYGTSLQPGTKEEALESYKRAVELAPERLIHRVEAGRVMLELGQLEDGRAMLESALECQIEDINAWQTQFDAQMLLAQLDRKPWTHPSLVPPGFPASNEGPPAALSTAALLGVPETTLTDHDSTTTTTNLK